MHHFYQYNIYRVSFYSYPYIALALIITGGIVFLFTFLSYQSPEIIQFDEFVEEAGCQDQLNNIQFVQPVEGDKQLFQKLKDNNLLCYFCLNSYRYLKPYGIHAIIQGELITSQPPQVPSVLQYSIGAVEKSSSLNCWVDSQSSTSLQSFPEIVSTNGGKHSEVQELKQESISWNCVQDPTKWVCKSDRILFQSTIDFEHLFGFVKLFGTQINDMHFAIIRYEEKYFQYNEVMYIVWIGLELVFGCLLSVLQDEFLHQRNLVFIPTMGFRFLIFILLVLNNHPLFLVQLIHDNIYDRMINVLFMCIAQGGFLFYSIHTSWRIFLMLEPKRLLKFANAFLCLAIVTLKAFLSLRQALDLLEQLPSESLFITGTKISYFAIASLGWLCYFYAAQIALFVRLRRVKRQEIQNINNDLQLRLTHKFYKGLWLFQVYNTLFVSAFLARIIWQFMVYFNPNSLYYDHYQTTLLNSYFVVLFWFFDLHNPDNLNETLEQDDEEISDVKQFQMTNIKSQMHVPLELQPSLKNSIILQEEKQRNHFQRISAVECEMVQLKSEQDQAEKVDAKDPTTTLRIKQYEDMAHPETQLRQQEQE